MFYMIALPWFWELILEYSLSKEIYRLLLRQVLLNRETRKLLVRLEDGLARLEQIYKAIIIICISLIS